MKVVLASLGSWGDIHPIIALALALRERHAEVTLCTGESHHAAVEGHDIMFAALTPDTPKALPVNPGVLVGPEFFEGMLERIDGAFQQSQDQLASAARDCDVIVATLPVAAAVPVARTLGKPLVTAVVSPCGLPQRTWRTRVTSLNPWRARPEDARTDNALAALQGHSARLRSARRFKRNEGLALGLFTPALTLGQSLGPPGTVICGAAVFEARDHDPAIGRWLAQGSPPLVAMFGSHNVTGEVLSIAIGAARTLGLRVLVVGSGEVPEADSDDVFAVTHAPASQVFPAAAAVLHHGGMGTLQTALKAGRPQVIAPLVGDQFDNAARARRLGVALVTPFSELRPEGLPDLLRKAISEEGMKARARALAQRMAGENGAARAAEIILARYGS